MITRRALAAIGLLSLLPMRTAAAASPEAAEPMDFDRLATLARDLRGKPYAVPEPPAGDVLDAIDYTEHQEIRQSIGRALFADTDDPITFFHLGRLFRKPVRIYALEGGTAREVPYSRGMFDYPDGNPASRMPDGAGYAGFRVHDRTSRKGGAEADWLAFLGASYFRSCGDGGQYGISARGIAVDTAPMPGRSEQFPDFTRFYVSRFDGGRGEILALLEGESVTGAYRFRVSRTPRIVMDVECRLFVRSAIDRLGIAPLTSMYWYSEGISRYLSTDWRPEVHDSDGLLMHTGAGETIWRPLNNPPGVMVSAFLDEGPRGFGLMQRDRSFASYIDEVHMESRPNLWVEPVGDWGKGSVQLVEIPTVKEYDDNVVAFWVPEARSEAGQDLEYAYRLHWSVEEPEPSPMARCVSTRASKAVPATDGKGISRQFVVEFDGKALAGIDPMTAEVVLDLSRGRAEDVGAWPQPYSGPGPWRVFLKVLSRGAEPIEMRMSLRHAGRTLSETWMCQYHPEAPGTVA